LCWWGVELGDRIGTMMWNSAWHMQAYHALSCMGCVLHTLNLRLAPDELSYIIGHAQDRAIISDSDLLPILGKVDDKTLNQVELFICCGLDNVAGDWVLPKNIPSNKAIDYDEFLTWGTEDFSWPDLPETAIHGLCYTSGTTGKSKGVAYSQRSTYIHTLLIVGADGIGLKGSSVVLDFVPMFHVLSWGIPYAVLMLGTRIVFTNRFMDPDSVLDAMVDWKVDLSNGVPTVWQGVRAALISRGVHEMRSKMHLKSMTCGGSSPAADMVVWYQEKMGIELIQGWGMTETNPLCTLGRRVATHTDSLKNPEELHVNSCKAGLLLPGLETRIADPDNLNAAMPPGEPGELLIRGPTIISEYFRGAGADKFHEGWLITGDVAFFDEGGALIISDRSKDVIKSGGEWISSIDLENWISAMDVITAAAVVAMPHPKWDERPVAIVIVPGATNTENLVEQVREHCLKKFAKFQLPDDVIVWPEIPLTSTGKISKMSIRAKLQEQGYVLPDQRNEQRSAL